MSDLLSPMDSPIEREERARLWTPENPGDAVVGRLVTVCVVEASWGEVDTAYIRARCGVLRMVHLKWSVLQREWEEKKPWPGDRIAITFDGTRAGGEQPFKCFLLDVDRPPTEPAPTAEAASEEEVYDAEEHMPF